MQLGMQAGVHLAMELQPWPQLITFAELLQLPALELEQRIERELAFNPALEQAETQVCPMCGAQTRCATCVRPASDAAETDWLARLADPVSLGERLIDEARLELYDPYDQAIAEHLLASMNGRGLLDDSLDEVSRTLHTSFERVERVLAVLRRVGDAGLGATSIRECLLLQLDDVERRGHTDPVARTLVTDHLEDLAHLSNARLASIVGTAAEHVAEAREFIRGHLHPPGGSGFGCTGPHVYPAVVSSTAE